MIGQSLSARSCRLGTGLANLPQAGWQVSAIIGSGDPGTFLNPARRRRGRAIALAVAIELALLLIVWFTPSFREIVTNPGRVLKTFDFALPKAGGAPKSAAIGKPKPTKSVEPPSIIPPPPVVLPKQPPNPLAMSASDYAATDISKLGGGKGGSSSGKGAGYGPPDGRGSEFYKADWYREPTRGELAAYLPQVTTDSWAVIVCKTAANYHVEDCYALAESPVGSGLARALRQASYQFLVRPPRENNRPMIGVWVRIMFDWKDIKDD